MVNWCLKNVNYNYRDFLFRETYDGFRFHIFLQKYSCNRCHVNFIAGFMSFKSLMKEREVVVDVWLAIIKGGGRQILMLLVMEVR